MSDDELSPEREGEMPSEANIFMVNPEGVKVHFKLTSDTSEADVKHLLSTVDTAIAAKRNEGYSPDASMGVAAGIAVAKARQENGDPPAPACAHCGGAVWDNRPDKKEGKKQSNSPDFKCKNREECGAAGWIQAKTGDIKWAKGNL